MFTLYGFHGSFDTEVPSLNSWSMWFPSSHINSKTKMLIFYFRDLELHIKGFQSGNDILVYKW